MFQKNRFANAIGTTSLLRRTSVWDLKLYIISKINKAQQMLGLAPQKLQQLQALGEDGDLSLPFDPINFNIN
ncbi:hypothetical protein BJP36_33385 [Moorena producens JHB]|uniref:Uncharacterized protein n=3 Tax=Moorena TaxID=1155738 RepID=A0A1D9G9D8_MOOP1|nr:hypothetical protein [Moorena producens]AOY84095.1 hypothetical protein BJP36_33385 [Moorena producens JHB]